MMQIRYGIFETNSSSTHSLYFANDKEWNDFTAGKTLLDEDGNFILWKDAVETVIELEQDRTYNPPLWDEEKEKQLTPDEFRALSKEKQYNDFLKKYGYRSFESFGEYLEYYNESYTTKHGDHINVFGEYGNNY